MARKNFFGETYCHTKGDLEDFLMENGFDPDQVYHDDINPAEGDDLAYTEILENESGDLVCYVEAASTETVESVLAACKVKGVDGV